MLPALRVIMAYKGDWRNHLWIVAYFTESLKHNFSFPLVLNTQEIVGMPYPLYYGSAFYKITALPSLVFGAGLGFRFVVASLFLLQFTLVRRLILFVSKNSFLSNTVAVLWIWSVYPLTNLYSRGAMTEFFAVSCLTCGLCILVLLILDGEEIWKSPWPITMGLFYLLVVGSHPITALFGGTFTFLIFLSLIGSCSHKKRVFLTCSLSVIPIVLYLLPWLYVTHKFYPILNMAKKTVIVDVFPGSLGMLWLRFLPFAYDPRLFTEGLKASAPFLDTQMNVFILLMVGFIFFTGKKKTSRSPFVIVSIFIFIVVFFLTGCSWAWDLIPKIYKATQQVSYRLVTYMDLSILMVLVGLLRTEVLRWDARTRKLCLIVLLFSGVVVVEKVTFAFLAQESKEYEYCRIFDSRQGITSLPPPFYAPDDYGTFDALKPLDENEKQNVNQNEIHR